MAAATDAFFGTSLALIGGDFAVVNGDLALVSGRDNFGQAMQVIVGTPFGSDQINVNYGLDVRSIFAVSGTVSSVKDVIRLNLVKSIAADDRVRSIDQIVFDDDPGFEALAPEFAGGDPGQLARRTRAWHAVVAITTVAGTEQQLEISGPSP